MAADSTMLRMVNLFMALSLGVHLEQLEQRMGLTWPRPFLLRPLLRPESQHPGSSPFISNPIHPPLSVASQKQLEGPYLEALFLTMIAVLSGLPEIPHLSALPSGFRRLGNHVREGLVVENLAVNYRGERLSS